MIRTFRSLVACLALAATTALAQSYPTKPIKLIVPFPPGGAVDVYARTVQPALAEALGRTIVIENKTGASGMIGAESVAKAPVPIWCCIPRTRSITPATAPAWQRKSAVWR